jgi:hypothetical protein
VAKLAFGASLLIVGCGGEKMPPREPEPAPEPQMPAPRRRSGMSMQTELGEIDQRATEQTFAKLQPQIVKCHRDGLKRIDYLAGDVAFFMRVGQDGRVRYAYLEQSTLGDRETERCLLDTLTQAQWPEPEGGEAEVRKTMGFDPPGDVRLPADWSADRIAALLGGKEGETLAQCREGASGVFRVTAYVAPAGKKDGKVLAAGVAPPSKEGAEKADCIVDAVKAMKMPSPGSYAAKVSFIVP